MNLIIVTGYNCASYIQQCAESLMNLRGEWKAIFISDGSTDGTDEIINALPQPEIISEAYQMNKGAAYRRFHAIHNYAKPDDIIYLLGMDDSLSKDAIEFVEHEYDNGKLMTYGNYKKENTTFPKELLQFDSLTHHERSYREVRYRSTALNTFKAELFFKLKEDDFKVKGEWIKATTESPIMFACLEMCGQERIGVIETPIYHYTDRQNQKAKLRFGKQYQNDIYKEIISRPKFELI